MARANNEDQTELDVTAETAADEKSLERKAAQAEKTARQKLDAMPKKSIEIPIDPLNPNDKIAVVGLNGVIYSIPRGIEVEVPIEVYNIWKDSDRRTKEVNRRIEESTRKEITVM